MISSLTKVIILVTTASFYVLLNSLHVVILLKNMKVGIPCNPEKHNFKDNLFKE